jgi:hypothetical protein
MQVPVAYAGISACEGVPRSVAVMVSHIRHPQQRVGPA